jgi:hypothetical protein
MGCTNNFKCILVSGFPNVFDAEHRFGDFLSGPLYGLWILGEYFRFSSIELMKKSLCKFINTHYRAVGQALVGARGMDVLLDDPRFHPKWYPNT